MFRISFTCIIERHLMDVPFTVECERGINQAIHTTIMESLICNQQSNAPTRSTLGLARNILFGDIAYPYMFRIQYIYCFGICCRIRCVFANYYASRMVASIASRAAAAVSTYIYYRLPEGNASSRGASPRRHRIYTIIVYSTVQSRRAFTISYHKVPVTDRLLHQQPQ